MSLIYLASPYTHDDPAVRERRFDEACRYSARLLNAGFHVFSPIAHGHAVARFGVEGDFAFWQSFCESMLGRCDAMVVLQLDGWRESVGVQHEIAFARANRIAVENVMPWQMPLHIGAVV